MRFGQKILLGTGIAFLTGGVAGTGITYRDLRTENLFQARTASVRVAFPDTASTSSAGFLPYREGTYTLYLSPAGPGGSNRGTECTPAGIIDGLSAYGGAVDLLVTDPSGEVRLRSGIAGDGAAGLTPGENGWVRIDSLRIPRGDRQWTLAAITRPDGSAAHPCPVEMFLLPPQTGEIGTLMEGGVFRLVGFGGLMFAGFVLIVLAGRSRS